MLPFFPFTLTLTLSSASPERMEMTQLLQIISCMCLFLLPRCEAHKCTYAAIYSRDNRGRSGLPLHSAHLASMASLPPRNELQCGRGEGNDLKNPLRAAESSLGCEQSPSSLFCPWFGPLVLTWHKVGSVTAERARDISSLKVGPFKTTDVQELPEIIEAAAERA